MFRGNDLPDFGGLIAFAVVGFFVSAGAAAAAIGFPIYCVFHTLAG